MKKATIIFIILLVLIIMSGCVDSNMFGLKIQNDEEVANVQMETFLRALEKRNTEEIASLFSSNTLKDVDDIQSAIDSLYSYYKGNYLSYDNWDATNTSTIREGSLFVKEIYGTYDVVTDAAVYRFAFLYVSHDSSSADNIGFRSIYIINMADDTDPQFAYRGDNLYIPGIQIGVPNIIPDSFEFDDTE